MRIGIDARFYGPIKQKGLGRYVQKLVEGLEKVCHCEERRSLPSFGTGSAISSDSPRDCFVGLRPPRNDKKETTSCRDIEFVIFLRRENWEEYQPKNPRFRKVLADYPWYSLSEQIFFPFKIRKEKIDLMHFPHFNLPLFYHRPFIVTIHDLILKKYPTRRASTLGPIGYFIKNLGYNFVIKSAVKRAKKIIAVSEYTKKDILRYFAAEPEKVKVIYEGAPVCHCEERPARIATQSVAGGSDETISFENPRDCFVGLRPPRNDKKEAVSRNDNYGRYLLYVGNAYPHKNLERLISAFEILSPDYPSLKLVLVGELDYFYRRLQSAVPKAIREKIVFTDFVSDERLAKLYQNAELYVFPSLCEGFGLPPLEAMANGLPVICSNSSCLPEILGKAALYFESENVKDMAEKIKSVLDNRELKEKLVSAGRLKIKKYDWQKTAEETLEEYQKT